MQRRGEPCSTIGGHSWRLRLFLQRLPRPLFGVIFSVLRAFDASVQVFTLTPVDDALREVVLWIAERHPGRLAHHHRNREWRGWRPAVGAGEVHQTLGRVF